MENDLKNMAKQAHNVCLAIDGAGQTAKFN